MDKKTYKDRKDELEKIVKASNCWREVCELLNIRSTNQAHIKRICVNLEIDYSHFGGGAWSKGKTLGEKFDIEEYFSNKRQIPNVSLKKRLIKEGYKELKCENCGLSEWMGKPATIELHHRDSNHFNNNLENLQMLCPNCHAMETKRIQLINSEERKKKTRERANQKEREKTKLKNENFEKNGKKIYKGSPSPSKNLKLPKSVKELIESVEKIGYRKTGKNYGVSHTTIRSWIETESFKSNKSHKLLESELLDRPDLNTLLNDVDKLGYAGTGRKYDVHGKTIKKWISQALQPQETREYNSIRGFSFKNSKQNIEIILNDVKTIGYSKTAEKHGVDRGTIRNWLNEALGEDSPNGRFLLRKVERPDLRTLLKDIEELGYNGAGRKYGVVGNTIKRWRKFEEKHNPIPKTKSLPKPHKRKVPRPPLQTLLEDVESLGYSATGRKYGVSDNAIRKWIKWETAFQGSQNQENQSSSE